MRKMRAGYWHPLHLIFFLLLLSLFGKTSYGMGIAGNSSDSVFPNWIRVTPEFMMGWRVQDNVVSFRCYSRLGGWLALGVSQEGEMSKPPSVAVAGDLTPGAEGVAQLRLTGGSISALIPLENPSLLPGGLVSTNGSVSMLHFQRLVNARDAADYPLDVTGGVTTFIFAHGKSLSPSYHGNERGSFKANLASGCVSDVATAGADLRKTRVLHGMTMFIGWSSLVSLGVMVARCKYLSTGC